MSPVELLLGNYEELSASGAQSHGMGSGGGSWEAERCLWVRRDNSERNPCHFHFLIPWPVNPDCGRKGGVGLTHRFRARLALVLPEMAPMLMTQPSPQKAANCSMKPPLLNDREHGKTREFYVHKPIAGLICYKTKHPFVRSSAV